MRSSLQLDDTPALKGGNSPQVSSLSVFRGGRFWLLPGVMLALGLLAALLMASAPSDIRGTISGLYLFASLLLALLCSFWLSFRSPSPRTRWAWRVIALAEASYLVAAVIVVSQDSSQAAAPSTSVADAFFLPFYPLVALGAILFPAIQSTAAKQVRVIVDVCIAICALVGLGLVFLIAPRIASGTAVDYVFIGYPVADLTVLLVLIVLLVRGVPRGYRPPIFWLTVGMLCFIYADSGFNYLTLPGTSNGATYSVGTPFVDPFWIIGAFALSLAPLSLLIEGYEPGATWNWVEKLTPRLRFLQPSQLAGQFLLLATPVLVLFGLIIFLNAQPTRGEASFPVAVLTLLVVLLIIVRQLLTMRDLVDARIATEQARQLDELKDQFITSVNHELRTPLMTMAGYLEMLTMPQVRVAADKQIDMLGRASRQSKTLINLVQSILDTRRIDQEASDFTPEVVHLATAAQAALTLIDPGEADPRSRIVALQVPDSLVVWGESVRVQQILTNLISNAIKYSPSNTPVTVRASLVAEQTGRLSSRSGQRMVEIKVQDQGLGIPPEQKDLLFRRFVRLPRDIASTTRGTGLGLYLCRVFAEAMGGSVRLESTGVPGEGSTFYVRLPLPPAQSSGSAPQHIAGEGIPH